MEKRTEKRGAAKGIGERENWRGWVKIPMCANDQFCESNRNSFESNSGNIVFGSGVFSDSTIIGKT